MKKKILINFILLIIILIFIEALNYYCYYKRIHKSLDLKNKAGLIQKLRYTLPHKFDMDYHNMWISSFVSSDKEKKDKRPILMLGCSYVYGSGLEDYQTMAYKLHKLTHRDVYKRGIPGGGINLALYQFETGIMKKEVPDAEYIIYVYIKPHLSRLYGYQLDYIETEINQRYKLKNGKLCKISQPVFPYYYSLFTVKNIQEYLECKRTDKDKNFLLFNAVMQELYKQAEQTYKNSKFIILLYPSVDYVNSDEKDLMPLEEIKILEKMGYMVINAEELTEKPIRTLEYRIDDQDHPNEKAWQEITPVLVKKLNL